MIRGILVCRILGAWIVRGFVLIFREGVVWVEEMEDMRKGRQAPEEVSL